MELHYFVRGDIANLSFIYTVGCTDYFVNFWENQMSNKIPHPNAQQAIEYWTRAAEDEYEWKNWECKPRNNEIWTKICCDPGFYPETEYRRIKKQKYIRIGDVDVPAPESEAPKNGTKYFACMYCEVVTSVWDNDGNDIARLDHKILHLSKENAQIHFDAIQKLNTQTPFEKE